MFTRMIRWWRDLRHEESGVTSLEYCILFGSVGFLIVIGSFKYIAPGITDRLDDAFKPEIVLGGGDCPAHNKGADGNCGVGVGRGGGNGTPNEGNGVGPGPDHEKMDNPVHGPS
jgi:Flp pilus assembly pilin Flp